MSHYWSMHGSIILSAPLLEGLTEDIRGYIEEDHLTHVSSSFQVK